MDLHRYIKILAFFLVCWANFSSTTAIQSPPPPTSVLAASETLRSHGYSLYASALISTFSQTAKLSGTILAAPDFIFAFSPRLTSRALPRPSTTLLLYHSLKPPSLRWVDLIARSDGDEIRTLHSNYCLFLFKNPNGEVSIASSKKPMLAVNIRQPDLYVDENLTIHGVDGVLDPSSAEKCSKVSMSDPASNIDAWVHRSFLDRAIRVLRRRGFHVAAAALALRRPDLLNLPAVTVFAPSDKVLFSRPDGFRYNARRHVVPDRLRFNMLSSYTQGIEFETLAPNKTIFIDSSNDVVTVNGVRIDGVELYQNKWVVLYSIEPMTLDDAVGESPGIRKWEESFWEREDEVLVEMSKKFANAVPSAASPPPQPPPPGSNFLGQIEIGIPVVSPANSQELISELVRPPSQAPRQSQCDEVSGVTVSELYCPVNDALDLPETEQMQSFPDIAEYEGLDDVSHSKMSKRLLQFEALRSQTQTSSHDDKGKGDPDPTDIAGDLFYYI